MAEKYSKMSKHAAIQQICLQVPAPQGQRENIPELISMVLQPQLELKGVFPGPVLALTPVPMLPTRKFQGGHVS